jgi:hypothetical protein
MDTSETTHSDLKQITVDRLTADLRKIDPVIAEGATFTHTEIENPAGVPMVLTSVTLDTPIKARPTADEVRRHVKARSVLEGIAQRKAQEAMDAAEGGEVKIEQKAIDNPRGLPMVATFSEYTPPPVKQAPDDTFVLANVPITAAPAIRNQGRANRQRGKTSHATGSRRSSTASDGDRGDPDPADLADQLTGVAA